MPYLVKLLLARGACIETIIIRPRFDAFQCCSSQEEHVLKLSHGECWTLNMSLLLARGACIETFDEKSFSPGFPLLLARGACIETRARERPSSLNALLLARGACIETLNGIGGYVGNFSCSSQEEHVLKHELYHAYQRRKCCSSQEEHVLKRKSEIRRCKTCRCSSQEEHVLKRVCR